MKTVHLHVCLNLIVGCLIITGCAHEDPTFRNGMQLLSEGKTAEGLVQLELATKQSPENVEYRVALSRQRELAIARLLTQGDSARANNNMVLADMSYRAVLTIDPENGRAKAEIQQIATDQRHKALVAEAEALFKQNDRNGADQRLRTVLAENPNQREARALRRRIDEAKLKESLAAVTLKSDLRRPITLEFRNADVRAVFEAISRSSGVNYIFDRDVRPDLRVTIQLRNKPIENAVQILLTTNQLKQKVLDEDTVLVYPDTAAKFSEHQELTVKAFHLANTEAQQMMNTIRTIVKTQNLVYDDRTNLLIMRDTPEAIRTAEKLVALQDQASPEVMLELEVLEVSTTRLQTLGFQWPTQISAGIVGSAGTPGQFTLEDWNNRNAGMVNLIISDPAVILNLKKTDTDTTVLANPRIRVRNREQAKVHVGERVPVITSISTANVGVSQSVSYLDTGLLLEFEPNVYLDDEVGIKVGLEVSNIISMDKTIQGTLVYTLGTRNASTVLRLRDGETQVLAGLISNAERKTIDKVPGLGDLPVLGHLFTNRDDNSAKTEIVLLITPRIVRNIVRPDVDIAEFASGTESNLGGPSLVGRPVVQTIPQVIPAPKPQITPAPKPPVSTTPGPTPFPPSTPFPR